MWIKFHEMWPVIIETFETWHLLWNQHFPMRPPTFLSPNLTTLGDCFWSKRTNTSLQDGQAMLWDLNEGKHLYTLDGGDVINALCFSPNRYWLCAATGPSIKIWVRWTWRSYLRRLSQSEIAAWILSTIVQVEMGAKKNEMNKYAHNKFHMFDSKTSCVAGFGRQDCGGRTETRSDQHGISSRTSRLHLFGLVSWWTDSVCWIHW